MVGAVRVRPLLAVASLFLVDSVCRHPVPCCGVAACGSGIRGPGRSGHPRVQSGQKFLPRLDPLADALTLTIRGDNEEVLADLGLELAAMSQREQPLASHA